jgi:hypothetical protein
LQADATNLHPERLSGEQTGGSGEAWRIVSRRKMRKSGGVLHVGW